MSHDLTHCASIAARSASSTAERPVSTLGSDDDEPVLEDVVALGGASPVVEPADDLSGALVAGLAVAWVVVGVVDVTVTLVSTVWRVGWPPSLQPASAHADAATAVTRAARSRTVLLDPPIRRRSQSPRRSQSQSTSGEQVFWLVGTPHVCQTPSSVTVGESRPASRGNLSPGRWQPNRWRPAVQWSVGLMGGATADRRLASALDSRTTPNGATRRRPGLSDCRSDKQSRRHRLRGWYREGGAQVPLHRPSAAKRRSLASCRCERAALDLHLTEGTSLSCPRGVGFGAVRTGNPAVGTSGERTVDRAPARAA